MKKQSLIPRVLSAALLLATSIGLTAQDPEQRWSFNGNLTNTGTAAGPDAVIVDPNFTPGDTTPTNGGGLAEFTSVAPAPGAVRMWGGNKDFAEYVNLGSDLIGFSSDPVTIELWATKHEVRNWARIFDFGIGNETGAGGGTEYIFMGWNTGTDINNDRVEWNKPGGGGGIVDGTNDPYTDNVEYHIVLKIEPGAGAGQNSIFLAGRGVN